MLFSSYSFIIIFLPLLTIIYYLLPVSWRNYLLLLASLIFYAWGGPEYLLVMLASITINYLSGLAINHYVDSPLKKIMTIIAVVLNLVILGYFKYTDFLINNLNVLTNGTIPLKHIVMPIGISFYTFQGLSYVLDIAKKKGNVLKNPLKLALYISFFPQLIAGPIIRYETISAQIDHRVVVINQINGGIYRFVIGLSKKILLANFIGEYASYCFSLSPKDITLVSAWTGALAFSLQIYYDFSGYSDMAIGLGAIFGFTFPENFRYPYISNSITDFWRRWHISLSMWFRDYVYIPLGGNRKGAFRQYINILIVWLLTGLWHGASWNFVVWGLYYAILLMVEKLIIGRKIVEFVCKKNRYIMRFLRHLYTLVAIMIGWVIFESPSLSYAINYISKMFDFTTRHGIWSMQLYHVCREYGLILAIGCLFSTPIYRIASKKISNTLSAHSIELIKDFIMIALFALCFVRLIVSSYNPFIYFRF